MFTKTSLAQIALVGNPNCGKTTMFNGLTGSSQYVGNWPGVTVEKKEGKYKKNKNIKIIDLPGVYSLSPYSPEEVISRNYILEEKPKAIINIVDGTNIERNLYLTTQVLELGIPVVVALNMMDVVRKSGNKIDVQKLSEELGCPVIETSAVKGDGINECIETAFSMVDFKETNKIFDDDMEMYITQVENETMSVAIANGYNPRWFAIKLIEKDKILYEKVKLSDEVLSNIEIIIKDIEDKYEDDTESIITSQRYDAIGKATNKCIKKHNQGKRTVSDKIDGIVTNRILALPIFAVIMYLVYYVSISTIGDMTIGYVEGFTGWISEITRAGLIAVGAANWLQGLIIDGIIAGIGTIFTFVPQLMILFFFLSLLEDCGYMSRVAFIMDRIFRKFGLSGKSFIPMIIGTGCSVPGIMAARTIENEKDRKMTIMLTPFIPCGAKLPVFALFIGIFFPSSSWVAPSLYFLGIAMVIISGIVFKHTIFKGEPAPFVMELPTYKLPRFNGVLIHMWDRAKSFIKKAGTIIFVACAIVWFLQSFSWGLKYVPDNIDASMLKSIGMVLAPIFAPLGFGTWQATVATVTGYFAKEQVVATMGILYGIKGLEEFAGSQLTALGGLSTFSQLSAYSFMVFTVFAPPCFAAIGAIKRELGSVKWTIYTILYQTAVAWILGMIIYQVGSLFI